MANLISFNTINTLSEFKKIKKSSNKEDTVYYTDRLELVSVGEPELKWNSVVFVKDINSIYYNLKHYGSKEVYSLGVVMNAHLENFYTSGYTGIIGSSLEYVNKIKQNAHTIFYIVHICDNYLDLNENVYLKYSNKHMLINAYDGSEETIYLLDGYNRFGDYIQYQIDESGQFSCKNITLLNKIALNQITIESTGSSGTTAIYNLSLNGYNDAFIKLKSTGTTFFLGGTVKFWGYEYKKYYYVHLFDDANGNTNYDTSNGLHFSFGGYDEALIIYYDGNNLKNGAYKNVTIHLAGRDLTPFTVNSYFKIYLMSRIVNEAPGIQCIIYYDNSLDILFYNQYTE